MKMLQWLLALSLVGLAPLTKQLSPQVVSPAGYEPLKDQAEELYTQGSYSKARELYQKADALELPAAEARWVDFRLADTLWRSQASTGTTDTSLLEQAAGRLQALLRGEERDRVWAEAQESMGDYWWIRRESRNWSQAWGHYSQALDWWGGARDIDLARRRYLGIVFRVAEPPRAEPYAYYGYYGNNLSVAVLENALKIVQNDEDRAHAHYLLAMTLRQQGGDQGVRSRVVEEFEAALEGSRSTQWYDDALYHFAEWLTQYGRFTVNDDGESVLRPDYVKALALYRRLVTDYAKGETRYFDNATSRIATITGLEIGVQVSNIFLPGTEVSFHLSWRNIKEIDLAVYKVELTRDWDLSREDGRLLGSIDLAGDSQLKTWKKQTGDRGDYQPGQETIRLDEKLPLGAYLLEATSGAQSARELILVTDAALVLKSSGRKALAYFCNAVDGSPIAGATVVLWENRGNIESWHALHGETNDDGMFFFDLSADRDYSNLHAIAALTDRQAFVTGYANAYADAERAWRIYAYTDRPAYRPGEQVRWKLVARVSASAGYTTPSGKALEYQIDDPRGTKVEEGQLTLNGFGSAWGSLELEETMPLGEYRVTFWDEGRENQIGYATLFRLEEYKLPEFKVAIQTPVEEGKKKTFRLGDKVEVEIQADYYFGGPVADATVEVLVYQNPYYPWWRPPREFPWYYEAPQPRHIYYPGGGGGQVVVRETLRTDAEGKAVLSFDTPRHHRQDLQYRIEARVTDASRREIIGSDSVRVTRQSYYVYPRARHRLYRPRDQVAVDFKTVDANKEPVAVEGTVKVTRDRWVESIGYEHEEILSQTVKTDSAGEAELSFAAQREGYYRIVWTSPDPGARPIQAETTVWVATHATAELGYRHGGLEIILDKDTFRVGQRAPVMLSVPTNDRYVLLGLEAEDIEEVRLVHVTGSVKLVELAIETRHVPNFFLTAAMVNDAQLFFDQEEIVVPPVRNFLDLEVKADKEQYLPGEEATLTVTARDHRGRPVEAEIGLGVADESIYYIQEDYAGDPRQFYFGRKRPLLVRTTSTFQNKSYLGPRPSEPEPVAQVGGEMRAEEAPASVGALSEGLARKSARFAEQSLDAALAPAASAPAPPAEAGLGAGAQAAVQVRSDFRSTVFWKPDVVTDSNGKATVKLKYADSLTGWKATARAVTRNDLVGIATATTRTQKPLMVRLQAPRFFVVGDIVTISALINNTTEETLSVSPSLDVEGLERVDGGSAGEVEVSAGGETRINWQVSVEHPGHAGLRASVRAGDHTDAMEKSYLVHDHGIEKLIAVAGKVRGDDLTVGLDLPRERRRGSTRMSVQVAPSLAVTMLDALPYLIDYPYGCTEQTLSRFLPAVITAKTLREVGLSPEAALGKVFGGIEDEYRGRTHPEGQKNLAELDAMVEKGLRRLYDFQHPDGGWGWWKDGESDHFMTAYVVWGLALGNQAGIDVNQDVLARGARFLDQEIVEEEARLDIQAWMLHALAGYRRSSGHTRFQTAAWENLWDHRTRLNAYTRALLALSAHEMGFAERARILVDNLENGVQIDDAPDQSIVSRGTSQSGQGVMATAHWGEDGLYWRWSQGGVEATAFALRALLAIDPENRLVEPVSNWLIKNRRGAQWSNTRDTAIVVLALNDYLRVSGEVTQPLEYEISVNGRVIARQSLTPEEMLAAPSRYTIDSGDLRDGRNEIQIRRLEGQGPIYFSVEALYFSLEEPVTAAGNEIFVRRRYQKLVPRPTLLKGTVYDRQVLEDGDEVRSGERVEVTLTIEAKNNYEYLVFEDLKPAGLEAVEIRSGEPVYARELKSAAVKEKFGPGKAPSAPPRSVRQNPRDQGSGSNYTGRSRWVYQELRDRKVALFIDKLPQGVWEIRYDLRAEVPGHFHALPVLGHAMYVPEIRCNGQELRIDVIDR